MRKRVQIALGVLLVVVAGIAWQLLREREPVYQGKTLSGWLESLDNPPGSARMGGAGWDTCWREGNGDAVKDALEHMGPDVIPVLRRMIDQRDHPLKLRLLTWARRRGLITVQIDDEWVRHYRAASACRLAKPEIRTKLLGDWIRLVLDTQGLQRDEAGFCFIMAAIGSLGPEACEPLIQALTNANTQLRVHAVTALFQFRSSQPEKVVPALLDRLRNDSDAGMQFNVAKSLSRMPPMIVPVLLGELRGNSVSARRWSLVALENFTNEVSAIVPAITERLEDKDYGVRQAATNALKKIDPEAAAKAGLE